MYKKGAGNDKQGKDAGNRTLCPYRNFSQAISNNRIQTVGGKVLIFEDVNARTLTESDYTENTEENSLDDCLPTSDDFELDNSIEPRSS